MFPVNPEDAVMLINRQQAELHEQLARERLAKAAQAEPAEAGRTMAQHVGVAHRLWAGARHLVHPRPTTHGTLHPA